MNLEHRLCGACALKFTVILHLWVCHGTHGGIDVLNIETAHCATAVKVFSFDVPASGQVVY